MEEQMKMRRRAQTLRKNQTKEENHLWYDFLKTYPVRFRRQYQIGSYYVDFFCYQAALVVELDGSQHYEPDAVAADSERTAWLQKQGIAVLRFSRLPPGAKSSGIFKTSFLLFIFLLEQLLRRLAEE